MKLQFHTNINCGMCVEKVQPSLDAHPAISSWEVDTSHPKKILTVHTDSLDKNELIEIIEATGYHATYKKKSVLKGLFASK